ncbi:MAG TPA: hypothetical protein VFY87_22955, partial [Geminicoccaceae bacterium]|nr:hypothetical protein [Geminicoccaceae bacterium]
MTERTGSCPVARRNVGARPYDFIPTRNSPGSGCASSTAPCGRTVPQECSFGSISGASCRGHSR